MDPYGVDAAPANRRGAALLLALTLPVTSCTFGPPEDRAVAHTARVPDTRTFLAAVEHERFRRPTGIINTFPNGGVNRTLLHEVLFFEADADRRTARHWATMEVPGELGSGFGVTPIGVAPDTFYVALSGCPGPECWGDLVQRRVYRVTSEGEPVVVDSVPARHRRGGQRVAPLPGESLYLRIGDIHHDSITARFAYPEEDRRTVFTILPTGELSPR